MCLEVSRRDQYIKTGDNIVNPTLVDLSKMKLEENFGDIDHLKSSIINMLNHPGMNILTANLVGNKNIELADGELKDIAKITLNLLDIEL